MSFTRTKLWMHRSKPGQVLMGLAACLLIVSVIIGQLTGYYAHEHERSSGSQERATLLMQVGELRQELKCRSKVGGTVSVEELRLLDNLADAFLTLGTNDDAEYARVARRIRDRKPFIERAIKERSRAETIC